jgi:hypothetical protein
MENEIEIVPTISTMPAVKAWFMSQDTAKFTLYTGYGKLSGESFRSTKDEKIEDVDLAWKELEKALSWCGYKGSFTLMATQSKNGTGGGKTCKLALKGKTDTEGSNAIGNLAVSENEVDRRIQTALQAERQARKIEDLEAQIGQLANAKPDKQNALERAFDKALEEEGAGTELISGIADSLREIGSGMKYLVMAKAGNGNRQEQRDNRRPLPQKRQEKKPEPPSNAADGDANETDEGYDGAEILQLLDDVEAVVPNHDPLRVLQAMQKMFAGMSDVQREFLINEKLKPNL